jgi:hypothetical protein
VIADGVGTAAVGTGMVPPVQIVKKTGPRLEKRFLDRRLAAPEKEKVKKPVGLKMRPAWWQPDPLGACPAVSRSIATARCGVRFCAGLEVADGDNLVPRPNPDGEGVGSMPQEGVGAVVGAVERWDDASAVQPNKAGAQQLVWQLSRQLAIGIVPGQGKSRSIQSFY